MLRAAAFARRVTAFTRRMTAFTLASWALRVPSLAMRRAATAAFARTLLPRPAATLTLRAVAAHRVRGDGGVVANELLRELTRLSAR